MRFASSSLSNTFSVVDVQLPLLIVVVVVICLFRLLDEWSRGWRMMWIWGGQVMRKHLLQQRRQQKNSYKRKQEEKRMGSVVWCGVV